MCHVLLTCLARWPIAGELSSSRTCVGSANGHLHLPAVARVRWDWSKMQLWSAQRSTYPHLRILLALSGPQHGMTVRHYEMIGEHIPLLWMSKCWLAQTYVGESPCDFLKFRMIYAVVHTKPFWVTRSLLVRRSASKCFNLLHVSRAILLSCKVFKCFASDD